MNIAVIFAGGVGSRMRSKELPKQFLIIHGEPVIVRTVRHFQDHPDVDSIVVACVPDWVDYCQKLRADSGMSKVARVVPGGSTGQESIYHGLCAAESIAGDEPSIVLIHDGVRPLINQDVITANIRSVKQNGSAITCVKAKETVLEVDDTSHVSSIPSRSMLRLARAPQSFWLKDIIAAHRGAIDVGRNDYIDSASMMMEQGFELTPIDGPEENIKVTTPDDVFAMRAVLDSRENHQIYGL